MKFLLISYTFMMVLGFSCLIIFLFRNKRCLLLVFPFLAVIPGIRNLYDVWNFMFDATRYGLMNRISLDFSNSCRSLLFDRDIILSHFFIWFISPLNSCFFLYFLKDHDKNMQYAYEECRLSIFQKMYYSRFKFLNVRIFFLILIDVFVYVYLIKEAGIY